MLKFKVSNNRRFAPWFFDKAEGKIVAWSKVPKQKIGVDSRYEYFQLNDSTGRYEMLPILRRSRNGIIYTPRGSFYVRRDGNRFFADPPYMVEMDATPVPEEYEVRQLRLAMKEQMQMVEFYFRKNTEAVPARGAIIRVSADFIADDPKWLLGRGWTELTTFVLKHKDKGYAVQHPDGRHIVLYTSNVVEALQKAGYAEKEKNVYARWVGRSEKVYEIKAGE